MSDSKIARRMVLKAALAGLTALPAVDLFAAAPAVRTPLDPVDPQATKLHYLEDAAQVDRKANPSYSPEQKCSTCIQYHGKPGESRGPCDVFPASTVVAAGWCAVWGQESGD